MSKTQTPDTEKESKSKGNPILERKVSIGVVLLFVCIGLFISFISFFFTWQADQSLLGEMADRAAQPKNILNKIGAYIGHLLIYKGFGVATFIPLSLLGLTALKLILDTKTKLLNKWFWGILWMLFLSVAMGFFSSDASVLSGVGGYELNAYMSDYIGHLGTALVLLTILCVYLVSKFHITPDKIRNSIDNSNEWIKNQKNPFAKTYKRSPITAQITTDEAPIGEETFHSEPKIDIYTHRDDIPLLHPEQVPTTAQENLTEEEADSTEEDVSPTQKASSQEAPPQTTSIIEEKEDGFQVEIKQEATVNPQEVARRLVEDFGEFDPTLELSNYQFPSIELLKEYKDNGVVRNDEELEENKNTIIQTLRDFKIEVSRISAVIGPAVTLYEIEPAKGIKIARIKSLEDNITMSLAAKKIRIIAPIPGKGTVGIEVPNIKKSLVSMRSVVSSVHFQKAEMELPVAFGKTISNETFVADLTKMPHMLMAGATGQGKSVGINAVITSLLYKKHPAELKFVFVDPKKVELSLYKKLEKHYLAKLPDSKEAIIKEPEDVIPVLNSLCVEMNERYKLLDDAMVRNIKEYNAKFKARLLNPNDGHRFLPYIVLVVDEFADLIMTAGKEVEKPVARLAQLARAIGIHLIIATQRPSVDIITGIIKANFPTRVAFKVFQAIDSKTILDSSGANQLDGKGDMLYTEGNELIRVQCAFVDTSEVENIVNFIGMQKGYPEAYQLPEAPIEGGENAPIEVDMNKKDPLLRDAAELIVGSQQGSTSMLQRKLEIGFARAGRIMDQLEALGVVGANKGSKSREVNFPDLIALQYFLDEKGM